MREVIRISKNEDKAIIMSFRNQPDIKLSSAQISDYIDKFIKISKAAAYKKIERMRKSDYLLYEKNRNGNYIHWLNPEIDFILEGPPLKFLKDPLEGITSAQLEHTSDLKEAIRTWIDNLSEPNPNLQLTGSEKPDYFAVVNACEDHILFRDLSNHLPELGIKVCEQWKKYKFDLLELLELKIDLLSALASGISKCFDGLKFCFTSNGKEFPGKHAFVIIAKSLYDMIIAQDPGDYVEFNKKSISELENALCIFVKNGDHMQWGGDRILLSVPEKDQAILEGCIKNFSAFLINIPHSEFIVLAKYIIAMADRMKPERDYILRKLEESMLYANFPGKCEYLGNSY